MPYICMMLGNVPPHSQAAWDILSEEIRACAVAEELASEVLQGKRAVPKGMQDIAATVNATETSFSERGQSLYISEVVSIPARLISDRSQ